MAGLAGIPDSDTSEIDAEQEGGTQRLRISPGTQKIIAFGCVAFLGLLIYKHYADKKVSSKKDAQPVR